MPITIDIEKDYLYNLGVEKGIEQGIEQGIEKGIEKERASKEVEFILRSFDSGISIDLISNITNVKRERVMEILQENNRV